MSSYSLNSRYGWLILLACGAGVSAGRAPAAELPGSYPGCAGFRADANLVDVPVNIFDPVNRVVNHLDRRYFRVFEDGVEQPIVAVGEDDTPVSVGFVFDTSLSMGANSSFPGKPWRNS